MKMIIIKRRRINQNMEKLEEHTKYHPSIHASITNQKNLKKY